MSKPAAGKCIAAWGKALCLCGTAFLAIPLAAQSSDPAQSRAVVQPLPPAGVDNLNTALMRLARNSQDLDALIDAGNASLQLNDIDAAGNHLASHESQGFVINVSQIKDAVEAAVGDGFHLTHREGMIENQIRSHPLTPPLKPPGKKASADRAAR